MSYYAITIFKGWDMPPIIVALIYQVSYCVQHLQKSLDPDKLNRPIHQSTQPSQTFYPSDVSISVYIISAHDHNGLRHLTFCDVADEHSTSVHRCASNQCWCTGTPCFSGCHSS